MGNGQYDSVAQTTMQAKPSRLGGNTMYLFLHWLYWVWDCRVGGGGGLSVTHLFVTKQPVFSYPAQELPIWAERKKKERKEKNPVTFGRGSPIKYNGQLVIRTQSFNLLELF